MNKIFVMADIHGSTHPVKEFYRRNKDKENFDGTDIIIILGDAGLNFFLDERDYFFKRALCKLPFTYFVVRGNHEERPTNCMDKNPDAWQTTQFFDGVVYEEKEFPKIKYAEDEPAFYTIKNYRTFIIPGAYSVDKYYRLMKGWQWFEDEQLHPEEMEWGKELMKMNNMTCDLVLSHTCPCIFEPTHLFFTSIDQSTVDKSMERYLGYIEYGLDYKAWMWGHYHAYIDYPRIDNRKKVMVHHNPINLEEYMENETTEVL